MPSAFGHVLVPLSLRACLGPKRMGFRLALFCLVSSAIPDLDVISFVFRIPYGSPWGHRGVSHSLFAALAWALGAMIFAKWLQAPRVTVFVLAWISTTSHTLLDALTNGGKGVALLWPWSSERFFFGFRPIQVSPIGSRFFSAQGLQVLGSEICWVGIPSILLAFVLILARHLGNRARRET